MNWSKFKEDYRIFAEWLENGADTSGDSRMAAIRCIIAVLQEDRNLDEAVSDILAGYGCGSPPETIYNTLSRWQQCLPRDPMLLGEIYERTTKGRRAQGIYYTPSAVVDFILKYTVALYDIVQNPKLKILDPACGCGYFLLKAYDVLREKFRAARSELSGKYPEEDWSDAGIHRHILRYNLWGADIDPVAAEVAANSLKLKQMPAEASSPNILICDSLHRAEAGLELSKAKDFWSSKYQFVIGNPPYLSFGLRGTARMEPDYADYLRSVFKESAEYKLSYYVLFMQRGIERLCEGGKLGFIVPDSFLLGRYYSKIRKYILENTAIETIAHMTSPVFKNATVGMSAICILRRQTDASRRQNQNVAVYKAHTAADLGKPMPCCSYPQEYFSGLPHNRIRLFFDLMVKNLVDRIEQNGQPLRQYCTGHTGVRSLTRQNEIIGEFPNGPEWKPGLISGRQIQRYLLTYEGHWLQIHPEKLHKGGWRRDIVEQRKILVRQTGFTLTAVIDETGYYHLNNIHSFVLCDQNVTLDYILLLLNSRLMAFYYHAVTMEYGRAMAQTDIETLELLPVRLHADIDRQAPELIRSMTFLQRQKLAGDGTADCKIEALDEYFNQLVYRIYGMQEDEVKLIEEYEKRLTNCGQTSRADL